METYLLQNNIIIEELEYNYKIRTWQHFPQTYFFYFKTV